MAYERTDLRSQLTTAPPESGANVAPQYFEYAQQSPAEVTALGSELWWHRSQSVVVNFVRLVPGDQLDRICQLDEFVVLIHDQDVVTTIEADGASATSVGRSLIVMPPGGSSITVDRPVDVVRVFTTQSADLCAKTANADFYQLPDPNVADFVAFPAPAEGHRIRVYALDEVPPDPDRFGRIYRCSTLMVNYFYEVPGPRDPTKMSPHHHEDFEQLSVQLAGDYVHHLRTPWTPDMTRWRDDEHVRCGSPSVTVIPPPSIHTSQAVGDTVHQLVDIFAPPRSDFSAKAGWVLNADEYPLPE